MLQLLQEKLKFFFSRVHWLPALPTALRVAPARRDGSPGITPRGAVRSDTAGAGWRQGRRVRVSPGQARQPGPDEHNKLTGKSNLARWRMQGGGRGGWAQPAAAAAARRQSQKQRAQNNATTPRGTAQDARPAAAPYSYSNPSSIGFARRICSSVSRSAERTEPGALLDRMPAHPSGLWAWIRLAVCTSASQSP